MSAQICDKCKECYEWADRYKHKCKEVVRQGSEQNNVPEEPQISRSPEETWTCQACDVGLTKEGRCPSCGELVVEL